MRCGDACMERFRGTTARNDLRRIISSPATEPSIQLHIEANIDQAATVEIDFARPGKRTDNAYIEAFNADLRAECLNASWLLSMGDARQPIEEWRLDCNENRPHTSLGNLAQKTLRSKLTKPEKLRRPWTRVGGRSKGPIPNIKDGLV